MLGAGSIAALLLVAVGWGARRGHRASRIGLGVTIAALGLALGFLGCLFLFLWIFTNHEVAYRNENLLQCVPFALLFVWQGTAMAFGRRGSAARAHQVAILGLACSAAGLVLKALPWFDQKNGHIIALLLPLWTGLALATKVAAGERGSGPGTNGHRLVVAQTRGVEGT